ncbi:MAG: hypothetical protein ACYS8W_19065 [Planctomycetota bacterium]|jgi:hypothetical protein
MRIGSLVVVSFLAAAFMFGCSYDQYVPEGSIQGMKTKQQVFNAAKDVVKKYSYALRENPVTAEIEGLVFLDNRFLDSTRGTIFVKLYKVSDGYFEPDVRVRLDIDTSEPDSFRARQTMQEWTPVYFCRGLEMKVKKEILGKLGMDFSKKAILEPEGVPAPKKTEPMVVEEPEGVKTARAALGKKLEKVTFEGITLEAAAKELGELTGLNIVLTGEATRLANELGVKIKLSLKNVKTSDALNLMLDNAGKAFFSHLEKGGVVVIDAIDYSLLRSRGQKM